MRKYTFDVNGAIIDAYYKEIDINTVFIPLLKEWSDIQKRLDKRIFVYLSAPPGCGKTTFSQFLEYLSKKEDVTELQTVGVDGFHYNQKYLDEHFITIGDKTLPLSAVKGSPITFDVEKLSLFIKESMNKDIYWPYYSRKIHNPIEDKIKINQKIILLEGNYLLLKTNPWANLKNYCSASLFLNIDKEILLNRLLERKIMTGRDEKWARDFIRTTDEPNIDNVINNSIPADHTIVFNSDNEIKIFY